MAQDDAHRTCVINTLSVTAANEGTRTMLTKLLPALHAVAPRWEQVLVCSRENETLFGFATDYGATILRSPTPTGSFATRIAADQVMIPYLARRRGDVLIVPTSVGPLLRHLPTVAVVTAHLALPSCQRAAAPHGYGFAHRSYYGWPLRRSLRAADRVLGISEFIAGATVDELGVSRAKVSAMPLGVEPTASAVPRSERDATVLFIGTLYGYKDAGLAVEAFARAAPSLPDNARLVIVGRDPSDAHAHLSRLVEDLGIEPRVELKGPVSDSERDHLLESSRVLVFPSRCEGFGLPAAEAMMRGLPVIAADATALSEVVSGSGWLCRPGDRAEFADAMVDAFDDDRWDVKHELGRRRSESLSWDRTALALAEALDDAVEIDGSRKAMSR